MLRITKLADAEYLLGQVALGIDDYYVGAGEAPGVWQGRLAAELGLAGVVEADALRALLLGRDPTTDAAAGHRRTAADGDGLRRDVLGAEVGVAVVGVRLAGGGVGGVDRPCRGGGGGAGVPGAAGGGDPPGRSTANGSGSRRAWRRPRSCTGRPGTVIPSSTRTRWWSISVAARTGRYAALDAAPLYEWGKAAGSVYQEELRRRLTERLGVEWGPDRHGCREIGRVRPGLAADVLEADGGHRRAPGRRRPGEPRPGHADEGGRGGIARHPAPQGRLPHPRGPPGTVAGRSGRDRDADRPRPRGRGVRPDHSRVPSPAGMGRRRRGARRPGGRAVRPPGPLRRRPRRRAGRRPGRRPPPRRDHRGPGRGVPRLRRRRPPRRPHRPALRRVLHLRSPGVGAAGPRPPRRPHHPPRRRPRPRPGRAGHHRRGTRPRRRPGRRRPGPVRGGPGHPQPDRPGRVREDHHRPRRRRRRHTRPAIRSSAWPPPTRPPANSARPGSRP